MAPTASAGVLTHRWAIAAAAVISQVALGGVQAWSVFRNPLMADLDATISDITFAFTLNYFVFGVAAFLSGRLGSRYSPRAICLAGGVLYGLGALLASFSYLGLWALYLSFGVVGGIGRGLCYIAPNAVVVKWFPDRRGLVTGLTAAGYACGALVIAPLAARLIALSGVSFTFTTLGVVYVVTIATAALLLKDPPAGYRPANWTPTPAQAAVQAAPDRTLGEAIRTPQYWAITWFFFAAMAVGNAMFSQVAPMAQSLAGVDALVAASVVGLVSLSNVGGRFFWPAVSDRAGRERAAAALFTLAALALVLLPSSGELAALLHMPSASAAVTFTILAGAVTLCFGGGVALTPAFLADYFGPKHVAAILGLTTLIGPGFGAPLGSTVLAGLRDATGDYAAGLYVLAAILLLTAGIALTLRPLAASSSPTTPEPADLPAGSPSAVQPATPPIAAVSQPSTAPSNT